jgi:hypothetical protein
LRPERCGGFAERFRKPFSKGIGKPKVNPFGKDYLVTFDYSEGGFGNPGVRRFGLRQAIA